MAINIKEVTVDGIDSFFLKIFRIILLLVMGLALLGALGSAIYSANLYFQSVNEPSKVPPTNQINAISLIESLKDGSNDGAQEEKKYTEDDPIKTLKYLEEVTRLFRCSQTFASAVGAVVAETGSVAASRNIENLRQQIETLALKEHRGDTYVNDLVRFACEALQSNDLINLRRENQIQGAFFSIINFHLNAWDDIFIQREETVSKENLKILEEKARAVELFKIAGILFILFMLFALYLIFAKIELNLRCMSSSSREL